MLIIAISLRLVGLVRTVEPVQGVCTREGFEFIRRRCGWLEAIESHYLFP